MMNNNVPTIEVLAQNNSEEASKVSELWEEYAKSANRLRRAMRKAGIDNDLLTEVIFAAVTFYTHIRVVKPERVNRMNSKLSESPLSVLSDSKTEAIMEALSENPEYVGYFKRIDDRLNQLIKIVPSEYRNALYDIERAIGSTVSIVNEFTYKQGLQDGMSLTKQTTSNRKPNYFILEVESHRKDVHKLYGGRTGWLYKLVKTLREYVDEDEADQDLDRLRSGEITEDEVIRKSKKKNLQA